MSPALNAQMNQPSSIHFNGVTHPLPTTGELTVADFLAQVQPEHPPESYATALNDVFLPRAARASTRLGPGDRLMTFAPITGG